MFKKLFLSIFLMSIILISFVGFSFAFDINLDDGNDLIDEYYQLHKENRV